MPIYVHRCDECKKEIEAIYSYKFIGKEETLPEETLKEISCKHGIMSRVPQATRSIMGAFGSYEKVEKQQREDYITGKIYDDWES